MFRSPDTVPDNPIRGLGKEYPVKGSTIRLFSISELAQILNRSPNTIRRWEREQVIPKATHVKQGQTPNGRRRLYTKEQVEGILRIAAEERILNNPHAVIDRTKFQVKVHMLFKELAAR